MVVEEVLVTQLNTITVLNKKVYPLNAPENTVAPYLVYLQSGGREYEGLNEYTGTMNSSYELNILHSTYKQMKEVSALVIQKLKTLQGNSFGGILIQRLSFDEDSPELYEAEVDLYRKIININITY